MSIIRVVDMETTGMEPPAEVCEVGWSDYDTETGIILSPQSHLCRVSAMPPEVRAIHHITLAETLPEMPWDADHFLAMAQRDGVAAFAAHKLAFEKQWLDTGGLLEICTYKVALRAWPDAPGHSNGVLRCWLEDEGKATFDIGEAWPPHRAGPDTYVTALILKSLFAAGITGGCMTAWSRQPAVLPRCPIGEHRNKQWSEVPWGFLNWMVTKAHDMDPDLKWNAQRELERRA
jgi:exodeoxyribonuclease X